jgi:hypothetical protein
MADNVPVTPTTSYTVAADDIAGVHHQRVKVGFGEDGAYGDVNATNALPVAGSVSVSGTVTALMSTVVSGTVTVNGTVTALSPYITTTQAAVTGLVVWLAPTQVLDVAVGASTAVATTTQAAVTGAVVWLAPTQTVIVGNINTIATIVTQLGTQIVSVVPGLSVSAVVSGTVTVINPVVSTIVTILGTQVVTVVPGLSVSAVVSGTVTAQNVNVTTTQVAATGLLVWLAPTQTLSVNIGASTAVATTTQAAVTGAVVWLAPTQTVTAAVSGTVTVANGASVTTSQIAGTGLLVWLAPTQTVSLVSTIVTILGTQIVTVAGGTTVVSGTVTAINSGMLFTIGLPTQASTAQIVVEKPAPMNYVQIAVTSTAIGQSAAKYLFTIWTGATGAPAAAGTTSWAVPAGQVVRLRCLQAAVTSSAVLGGSVQVFVGVGATASMVSASIQTQLQVMKLQLYPGASIERGQLQGLQADIPAGESIAVFIVASTAAVLRDLVIGGNIY